MRRGAWVASHLQGAAQAPSLRHQNADAAPAVEAAIHEWVHEYTNRGAHIRVFVTAFVDDKLSVFKRG